MSKAEKFIQDYTRNCSNEILSPYSQIINDIRRIDGEPAKEFSHWLTPDEARKAVEIAREEMLKWFEENAFKYIEKQDTMFGTIKVLNSHKLVNDLKQAMKDE